jgi:hypothetical protein
MDFYLGGRLASLLSHKYCIRMESKGHADEDRDVGCVNYGNTYSSGRYDTDRYRQGHVRKCLF